MRRTILLPVMFAIAFLLGQGQASAQETLQAAVVIDGSIIGYFSECSGMGSENEIIENIVHTPQEIIQKIPGRLKLQNITCRRPLGTNSSLWKWRGFVEQGNVA